MELNLTKPIIFFDLETTGTNITHDRIVEISLIKVMPGGEEIERTRRINPPFPKKYAIIFDKSAWNGFCILENRCKIPHCIDDVIL